MARLYLIRHPHTQVEPGKPSSQWTLSARGLRELDDLLGMKFWRDLEHVYASPEPKAAIVGRRASQKHGVGWSAHAELAELSRPGAAVDEYETAIAAALAKPHESVNGWETVNSVRERIVHFVKERLETTRRAVAVVSHGVALSALRADLMGDDVVDFDGWRSMPFAAVAVVDTESWTLTRDFCAGGEALQEGV